jgi:hypothetical protein
MLQYANIEHQHRLHSLLLCWRFIDGVRECQLQLGHGGHCAVMLQVWQASVVHKQCGSLKPWISHPWNCFELLRYAC